MKDSFSDLPSQHLCRVIGACLAVECTAATLRSLRTLKIPVRVSSFLWCVFVCFKQAHFRRVSVMEIVELYHTTFNYLIFFVCECYLLTIRKFSEFRCVCGVCVCMCVSVCVCFGGGAVSYTHLRAHETG